MPSINVKVIWATAATDDGEYEVTSVNFDMNPTGYTDQRICEDVFTNTNLYSGPLWDLMQPLPLNRTHTSISVGDYVVIDGRMYRCASVGWERTDTFIPGLRFSDPREPSEVG